MWPRLALHRVAKQASCCRSESPRGAAATFSLPPAHEHFGGNSCLKGSKAPASRLFTRSPGPACGWGAAAAGDAAAEGAGTPRVAAGGRDAGERRRCSTCRRSGLGFRVLGVAAATPAGRLWLAGWLPGCQTLRTIVSLRPTLLSCCCRDRPPARLLFTPRRECCKSPPTGCSGCPPKRPAWQSGLRPACAARLPTWRLRRQGCWRDEAGGLAGGVPWQ